MSMEEELPKDHPSEVIEGDLEVPSEPSEGAAVAERVQQMLVKLGWTEEDVGNFKTAVLEAMANAILHGNKGDASKEVKIGLRLAPDSATS